MAGIATLARFPGEAEAHDLRPVDPAYQFNKYEAIVNRRVRIRQLYAWPNIQNPIIDANISNGLNGFQFSYDIPPDQIQVVRVSSVEGCCSSYDTRPFMGTPVRRPRVRIGTPTTRRRSRFLRRYSNT